MTNVEPFPVTHVAMEAKYGMPQCCMAKLCSTLNPYHKLGGKKEKEKALLLTGNKNLKKKGFAHDG